MRTARSKTKHIYLDDETQAGYSVDAYGTFYYDSNYGADADGNRGIGLWFQEDFEIVKWYKGNKEIAEKDIPKKIKEKLIDKIAEYNFEIDY